MKERVYEVTLTGTTSMLMHWDSIEWSDYMKEVHARMKADKTSVAGDDRSPAFTWVGYTYNDGEHVCVPWLNVSAALRKAGASVPAGNKNKTFKAQTQSGIRFIDAHWKLLNRGKHLIPWEPIGNLTSEPAFEKHREAARELGFSLDIRRASVNKKKHVRVRPMFPPGWKVKGRIAVTDDLLTTDALNRIFVYAGNYMGLGDWRPGGPTPGPYGTFAAELREVK